MAPRPWSEAHLNYFHSQTIVWLSIHYRPLTKITVSKAHQWPANLGPLAVGRDDLCDILCLLEIILYGRVPSLPCITGQEDATTQRHSQIGNPLAVPWACALAYPLAECNWLVRVGYPEFWPTRELARIVRTTDRFLRM